MAQSVAKRGSRNVEFQVGESVMVDDFSVRNKKRIEGRIVQKLSPVTFRVEVEGGKTWKRHVDQIIKFPETTNHAMRPKSTNVNGTIEKPEIVVRRSERLGKSKVQT
ncbi:hypothetical protein RF55_8213 [Lasius niger]|uniref:Uncharacterized protein n=1 Tax=Lasius niger TaxID=67767 RepID=A0A0J7KNH9_LASNI|nr:hypothetical protein RF55_8213 [Lasius niger]